MVLRALILDQFWGCFHKLWGQAKDGKYDKRQWVRFQETANEVLRFTGIERRQTPRDDVTH